jgi:uncharacterized protein
MQAPGRVRQNNPAELKAFETTCERLAGFDPDISFEWVDGFLAALASGPRLPPTDDWLLQLCGDSFERAFADPPDAAQALRSLQVRLKVLCDQLDPAALMDDPQALRLDPLMSEWTDEERRMLVQEHGVPAADADAMQTGGLWAEGFMHAVQAWPGLWAEPLDDDVAALFVAMLEQISVLLIPPGHADFQDHLARYYPQGEPTRDELLSEACGAAQDLRLFWVDHAAKPATRRVEAAPGRNDPCPCGSGRKFKKCHGLTS